ncbi:MAG: DUF455 family protein [Kofleriaceae bacterium]|nr:DUF455 family protein [Kofleriaceae bacterium]MCL4222922.1 DUF455 family protein [Myxococcales bacterium]
MTVRDFARRVVTATELADKLAPPPPGLTVDPPGPPERLAGPGRSPALVIRPGREVSVPPLAGMRDPAQRARILHALANHELQAAELFAWALVAFADAPAGFRAGLLAICADEQRHCRAYAERAAALGCALGDHPVTGHFWNKLDRLATPLGFVCTMGLTFENANLDFTLEYAAAARAAGDEATAAVLEQVHADEIDHVRFAWTWLGKLAPDAPPAAVYARVATAPLGLHRARGATFDRGARRRAGLDEAFIAALEAAVARRPGGGERT